MKGHYILYPTDEQKVLLEKNFKYCRVVYNEMLSRVISTYEETGSLDGVDWSFDGDEYSYLKDVDPSILRQRVLAYQHVYFYLRGAKAIKPEFEMATDKYQCYMAHNVSGDDIVVTDNTVLVPGVGVVKMDPNGNEVPEDKRVSSMLVGVDREDPENHKYTVFIFYTKYHEDEEKKRLARLEESNKS